MQLYKPLLLCFVCVFGLILAPLSCSSSCLSVCVADYFPVLWSQFVHLKATDVFGHLFPLLLSLFLSFSLLNYWLISACFSRPCKESPVRPDLFLPAPLLPPSLPPILCHHLELFSSLLWGIQWKEARRQTSSEMGCYVEGWKEHLRSGIRENKMWTFFRLKKKSWHPVMTGILAEPTMWLGNRRDGVSVAAFAAHNCRDRTCVNDCGSSRKRGVTLRNTKQLTTVIRSLAAHFGSVCSGWALRTWDFVKGF